MLLRNKRGAKLALLALFSLGTLAVAVAQPAQTPPAPARVPRPYSLATVQDATRAIRALNSDDDTVVSAMMDALLTGRAYIPFDSAVVRHDETTRVRFIGTFGPILKRIVASQIFRDIYAEQRLRRIEARLPPLPPTYDEHRAARIAELSAQIAAAERTSRDRQQTPAARALARNQANTLKAEKRALSRGRGDQAQRDTMTAARTQAEQLRLARRPGLEAELPPDVNVLVARRLREFLALTEDMDFDARTRRNDAGRLVFRDEELEAKPATWKLCFRAGEDTIEAAREFAEGWLRSLPRTR